MMAITTFDPLIFLQDFLSIQKNTFQSHEINNTLNQNIYSYMLNIFLTYAMEK